MQNGTANSRASKDSYSNQRPTIIFVYFTVYSNANCDQKFIQAKELNNYDSYDNHCNFKSGVIQ